MFQQVASSHHCNQLPVLFSPPQHQNWKAAPLAAPWIHPLEKWYLSQSDAFPNLDNFVELNNLHLILHLFSCVQNLQQPDLSLDAIGGLYDQQLQMESAFLMMRQYCPNHLQSKNEISQMSCSSRYDVSCNTWQDKRQTLCTIEEKGPANYQHLCGPMFLHCLQLIFASSQIRG